MTKDIVADRQRAYGYIKYLFKDIAWDISLTDNQNISSYLDVPLGELCALDAGLISPSIAIVNGVKNYFKDNPDSLIEIEIQQFLVDPFVKRERYST